MKKLLALTLVLCMASLTSAELLITGANVLVNPGDSVSIGLRCDGEETVEGTYELLIDGTPGMNYDGAINTINSGSFYSNSPDKVLIYLNIPTNQGSLLPVGQLVDGIQLTNITELVELSLMDSFGSTLDTATIDIIPEPTTMALLGVGTLLLRRRK